MARNRLEEYKILRRKYELGNECGSWNEKIKMRNEKTGRRKYAARVH